MAVFNNQATLTYSGGTINSNITTGEIIGALSGNKTVIADEYTIGSELTYVINIINSSDTPVTGISVTDDLGAYSFEGTTLQPLEYLDNSLTVFNDGVQQSAPTIVDTSPLAITNLSVSANGVTTVVYTARVNTFASPAADGSITNTAVIRTAGNTEIPVTETIPAASRPSLSITKSVSPTTVTENGTVTYTFVIQNTSNTAVVATDNVVVTDTFDPVLRGIIVNYNDEAWTDPENYTYNEATGEFATVLGEILIPAATFTQNQTTGEWSTIPGEVTLTVTGTIG